MAADMSDHDKPRNRPARSHVALRFDEITLAAFVTAVLMLIGTVFYIGVANSEDRLGCGLNDLVNRLLGMQQTCR